MSKEVRRGYRIEDEKAFGKEAYPILKKAGEEIYFLINRGYDIKPVVTFVGNHYLLSERQRLALTRMIAKKSSLLIRRQKELSILSFGDTIHIDGFNIIISLEVALSNSFLIKGLDGTIRDLAGLRGTYQIIDKTKQAILLIFEKLAESKPYKVCFYLDSPVSNSGRLKTLILEIATSYSFLTEVTLLPQVDSLLSGLPCVITTDAIILEHCISWYNLTARIVSESLPQVKPFCLSDILHEEGLQ